MSADDALWDMVVELWFPSPLAPVDKTRIERLVKNLKAKGATSRELKRRKREADYEWAAKLGETSPEAVLKHWDRWRKKPPRRTWPDFA